MREPQRGTSIQSSPGASQAMSEMAMTGCYKHLEARDTAKMLQRTGQPHTGLSRPKQQLCQGWESRSHTQPLVSAPSALPPSEAQGWSSLGCVGEGPGAR